MGYVFESDVLWNLFFPSHHKNENLFKNFNHSLNLKQFCLKKLHRCVWTSSVFRTWSESILIRKGYFILYTWYLSLVQKDTSSSTKACPWPEHVSYSNFEWKGSTYPVAPPPQSPRPDMKSFTAIVPKIWGMSQTQISPSVSVIHSQSERLVAFSDAISDMRCYGIHKNHEN